MATVSVAGRLSLHHPERRVPSRAGRDFHAGFIVAVAEEFLTDHSAAGVAGGAEGFLLEIQIERAVGDTDIGSALEAPEAGVGAVVPLVRVERGGVELIGPGELVIGDRRARIRLRVSRVGINILRLQQRRT